MQSQPLSVAIIGAGPAGLMAAQVLSEAGIQADVFDAMPSVGRKFLLAGRGGLNLTHSESFEPFMSRYGARRADLESMLRDFDSDALRSWAHALGIETFVGTSGRVFPKEMKAAPLLRAWLQRLRHPPAGGVPVRFHMRHRWVGWGEETMAGPGAALRFETPAGEVFEQARVVLLALGGASWPRLGSDGTWVARLTERGIDLVPLAPANCGFDSAPTIAREAEGPPQEAHEGGWSAYFRQRYAGHPLKFVAITVPGHGSTPDFQRRGEFVITATGIEGSLIYAASALLRDTLAEKGAATLVLDLLPAQSSAKILDALQAPREGQSLANHLRRRLRLDGVKAALLREVLPRETMLNPGLLASFIKALPIVLAAPRPIEEAISTAGGVPFEALDESLQLKRLAGVYCAGEMLDWEAPTGGYLLTACMASGVRAARGAMESLRTE